MGKKLKIAMVAACPFPANHGSPASIREMSEALVKLGHEVHIVTYPVSEQIPVHGVTVHRVSLPIVKPGGVRIGPSAIKLVYDFLLIFKLISVMRRHGIDVIHAHNYEAAMVGWIAKVFARRPMIYNAVTTMKDELPTYDFIRPRMAAVLLGRVLDYVVPRGADIVTVVSDELADYQVRQGIPPGRVRVVPAGVNVEMFAHADGAKIRDRHGLVGVPLVMYTGAFEEFQRIDCLLQAMQWVVRCNPRAHLMLVGNVKHAANLRKYSDMALGLGIGGHVTFLETVPLSELPDYLAAADIAVVPRSDCPGHPVKLLNYMAAAKPIVSFKGGGKGLHHMHNGYLAENHDCTALGRGIEFLLGHPELARSLGARAQNTIRDAFDWDTLARGIEILYQQLVDGADSASATDGKPNPYLKGTYVLQYVNRRGNPAAHAPVTRSGLDRRTRNVPIETLERRKVEFPPSANKCAVREAGCGVE